MVEKKQPVVSQNSVLSIHQSTVNTLNKTEKFFLDIFVREGSAIIVPDEVSL
jgi:hypothetical protein